MLTVTGLSAPWYILTADDDGKPLKVLSKDELARGVNLSDLGSVSRNTKLRDSSRLWLTRSIPRGTRAGAGCSCRA